MVILYGLAFCNAICFNRPVHFLGTDKNLWHCFPLRILITGMYLTYSLCHIYSKQTLFLFGSEVTKGQLHSFVQKLWERHAKTWLRHLKSTNMLTYLTGLIF